MCSDDRSMPKETSKETIMQAKERKPHLRAKRPSPTQQTMPSQQFCTKEMNEGLALYSVCDLSIASPVDVNSINLFKQLRSSWEADQLSCS